MFVALATQACTDGARATTVRGMVTSVNANAEAISLDDDESYMTGSGLWWLDVGGTWHSAGVPECLPPLSRGAEVELGLVSVSGPQGDIEVVAWVECLSLPTEVEFVEGVAASPYANYCRAVERNPCP